MGTVWKWMGNCMESDHIEGSHPPKNLLRGKERESIAQKPQFGLFISRLILN